MIRSASPCCSIYSLADCDQLETISLPTPGGIRKHLGESVGFVPLASMEQKFPDNGDMADQNVFFFENEMNGMHFWPFYPGP